MKIRRVIEGTKAELIELVEERLAAEALAADPNGPKKLTTKQREAHEAAAKAYEWMVETLRDWTPVDEPPAGPPATTSSNGESGRRAAAAAATD